MPLAMRSEIMRTMALFCGSWGRSRGMGRVSSRYSRMASCSEGTLRQGEGLGSLDQRGEASKLPFCNVWYHHHSLLSWSAIKVLWGPCWTWVPTCSTFLSPSLYHILNGPYYAWSLVHQEEMSGLPPPSPLLTDWPMVIPSIFSAGTCFMGFRV